MTKSPVVSPSPPDSAAMPDVQYLNLTLMMWLQVSATQDPALAAYLFDLPLETIEELRSKSVSEIQELVAHVDVSLFKPRVELMSLMKVPAPLAGVLASVRRCGDQTAMRVVGGVAA